MDSGAVTFFTGFAFTVGFVVVLIELVVMCVASLISRKEKNMSFQKQIKAGAKLLDEKVPGWIESIDLEKLYLGDPCNCIVGQSCSDMSYSCALEELFGEREKDDLFDKSDNHGFATYNYAEYPQLTEEWKSYIQKRRDSHVSAH